MIPYRESNVETTYHDTIPYRESIIDITFILCDDILFNQGERERGGGDKAYTPTVGVVTQPFALLLANNRD